MKAEIRILLDNGIEIRTQHFTVHLDPLIARGVSFTTHAHYDHIPRKIENPPYCTEETHELIRTRFPNFQACQVEENKVLRFEHFQAKLLSSGHMLGAAQVYLEMDGCSLLYTGDLKLTQSMTAKDLKFKQADVLILESTYGMPCFRFPCAQELREQTIRLAQQHATLLCHALGKAQEVIRLLNKHNLTPWVNAEIKRYVKAYAQLGIKLRIAEQSELKVKSRGKGVLISGRAILQGGIPLSDHCDFEQLLMYAQLINPRIVCCVHGFATRLAKEIEQRLGIRALPLLRAQTNLLRV